MGDYSKKMRGVMRFAGEVVAETLWPTRCASCDALGKVLCDSCARSLSFLDPWRACPRCGSPFGRVQCDCCNPVSLAWLGRDEYPYAAAASATMFDDMTGRVVRVFKDQGEQRLAAVIAGFMSRAVPPAWGFDAVTFVPASKGAYRSRGFDHMELVARRLAPLLGMQLVCALDRPVARDQRKLGGRGRIDNLRGGFSAFGAVAAGRRLLLVDDVMTTGSTMCAATDALLDAGAREVFCLTFARV